MRWFRIKPGHLTEPSPTVDAESLSMRVELARREYAFEQAVAEMGRPRLTTETILENYLAAVMGS